MKQKTNKLSKYYIWIQIPVMIMALFGTLYGILLIVFSWILGDWYTPDDGVERYNRLKDQPYHGIALLLVVWLIFAVVAYLDPNRTKKIRKN